MHNWQFSYIELPFVVAFLLCCWLSFYCLSIKNNQNFKNLAFIFIITGWWALCGALEIAVIPIFWKIFWSKAAYIAIELSPVLYFNYTWNYTTNELTDRLPVRYRLLYVFPALVILLVWTNEYHYLFWNKFTYVSWHNLKLLDYQHHFLIYSINVAYSYILLLAGSLKFIYSIIRYPDYYRHQVIYMLLFLFFPFTASLLYNLETAIFRYIDFTSVGLCIGALIAFRGALRSELFTVLPVARDLLPEMLTDGMLVLGQNGQIKDFNSALLTFFSGQKLKINQNLIELIPDRNLCDRILSGTDPFEIEFSHCGKEMQITVSPVTTSLKKTAGKILIMHDITELKAYELLLERQKKELEASLIRLEKTQQLELELERKNSILAMIVTANHEINQPLCVLKGYLDILRNPQISLLDEKKSEYLVKMGEATDTIARILEKYSRSEQYEMDSYLKSDSEFGDSIKMLKFSAAGKKDSDNKQ